MIVKRSRKLNLSERKNILRVNVWSLHNLKNFLLYILIEMSLFFLVQVKEVTLIGTNVANPIDKYDIINDAEQIQLTDMKASGVELWARGKELHCTGEHICQLGLQGIADYRSMLIGFATLDNLRCWQDNHLPIIE